MVQLVYLNGRSKMESSECHYNDNEEIDSCRNGQTQIRQNPSQFMLES